MRHRWTLIATLGPLFLALCLPACGVFRKKDPRKSVVKITTTIQNVDYYEPWKPGSQDKVEGCGCVVKGNRVLTTARMAVKNTYIEVQRFGDAKRYVAKVEQIADDLSLAMLTVEDKEFWKNVEPAALGQLPAPGDKVRIYGGDELSVKDDTISGLDMVWLAEVGRPIPGLITNQEIDSKNNGCPVFKNDKLIGIVFESWHQSEKSGSLIPVNVVERFFRGVENGRLYDGFPDTGAFCQKLENRDLHQYFKLSPDQTGVVVAKVLYDGSAVGHLQEGDVITEADGWKIDNEGMITLKNSDRVHWEYLVTFYMMGEKIKLSVIRDGQPMKLEMPLKPLPKLVPYKGDNRRPTYLMFAGIVFAPLTVNYVESTAGKNLKPALKDMVSDGFISEDRQEVVLISHVLPHDINTGYGKVVNALVTKVNGLPVKHMRDLLAALDKPVGKHHVIELEDHAWFGTSIVLDAEKAKAATQEIMASLKIPVDRSEDLK